VDQNITIGQNHGSLVDAQLHSELARGDWEALHKTAGEWLQLEPGQPVASFIQNMACLYINPPAIIQNKRYLETVKDKEWKPVLSWYKEFNSLAYQHNPYFQAIDFILQPTGKKKDSIETAIQEHPDNPELLFLQAISLRDRNASIEKLKLAVNSKPDFPAALYLLGIFSLQLNQVETAESYLKQAVDLSPDFLEAHYQLGSLYTLYLPNSAEQAKAHFEKVIELDPEGGAGIDAKRVLEGNVQPQYGQRIGSVAGGRRGGMSILTILGISLLTVALFSGPIASLFKITNPSVGILAGMFVFIGLYSALGRRKS
jgi:tetratricopeptide (TPR) repeat protein